MLLFSVACSFLSQRKHSLFSNYSSSAVGRNVVSVNVINTMDSARAACCVALSLHNKIPALYHARCAHKVDCCAAHHHVFHVDYSSATSASESGAAAAAAASNQASDIIGIHRLSSFAHPFSFEQRKLSLTADFTSKLQNHITHELEGCTSCSSSCSYRFNYY